MMEEKVGAEANAERRLNRILRDVGESPALRRFLSGYGKVRTRTLYAECLWMYSRWLKEEKGVDLSFDGLVKDNLEKVFGSNPVDVASKRTHMDWMNEYVNEYQVELGLSESRRNVAVAAIRGFYAANDSALFGHFRVAMGPLTAREKPLKTEDIRTVLKAMSLHLRTPFLAEWQSGIEINRLLCLK